MIVPQLIQACLPLLTWHWQKRECSLVVAGKYQQEKRTWSWHLKSAYTFYPDKLQSLKLVVIIILHPCVNHIMHVFVFSLKPAGSHWLLKKAWCSHLATQTRTLPTRHASTSLTVQQARSSVSISPPSTWTVMASSVAVTMWRYSSTPCQSSSQL